MSKVFLVTGAGSGIGLALSKRLLSLGHRVCVCDINQTALRQHFTPSAHVIIQPFDIRQISEWQTTIAQVLTEWQRLDVLCNVAGVLQENWVKDITPEQVDWHFDINVKGTIFGTQSVIDTMQRQGDGHIINIASLAALSAVPGLSLYSASKFAVRSYSLAAAVELAEYGIAVTTLCPDGVQTPMLDQQKGKAQAALTFSGRKALTTEQIVDCFIADILPNRPVEVMLPLERGVAAKIANLFPATAAKLIKTFQQKGMQRTDFNG